MTLLNLSEYLKSSILISTYLNFATFILINKTKYENIKSLMKVQTFDCGDCSKNALDQTLHE